jgi:hypothetical protein
MRRNHEQFQQLSPEIKREKNLLDRVQKLDQEVESARLHLSGPEKRCRSPKHISEIRGPEILPASTFRQLALGTSAALIPRSDHSQTRIEPWFDRVNTS